MSRIVKTINVKTGEETIVDNRTPEQIADQEAAARAAKAKAECQRLIYAHLSLETQLNLMANAGSMSNAKKTAYTQAKAWIADMRATCQARAAGGSDEWPECPQGVIDMAADY